MKRIVKYPALLILSITFLYAACDDDGITPPPYDGPWEKVPVPEGIGYAALDFTAPDDGWVVGYKAVGHYDGSKWEVLKTFENDTEYYAFSSVVALSPSDVWISGFINNKDGPDDYRGVIVHYDGTTWDVQRFEELLSVTTIYILPDGTGWAGGSYGLVYYDGENWEYYGPSEGAQGFYFDSPDDGWMVALTRIYHWDGTEWTEVLKTRDTWLYDIDFAAPDDGWAVGDLENYHYDGTEWSLYGPLYRKDFSAVHFLNENFGWGGFSRTYFYDGETWTEVDDGEGPSGYGYYDLFCVSENDVWGCAPTEEGYFLHFTGFD
jgi:photosystem II stability/assembly factor-like uncharacterized protein